jgi:hypothetical protein
MSRVATPAPSRTTAPPAAVSHEKIAQRAYERWMKRGCPHGSDLVDWVEAEKELKAEFSHSSGSTASFGRR